ncbi:serine/threonine-protein kinase rio2 [Fagus crenata]
MDEGACICPALFNLSFEESLDDIDDSEVNTDENGRPCFSSIAKGAGSLDKELAASGFTRKDQEDIEKFIEGGIEKDADSSDEESEDEGHSSELNESDISGVESLHLVEQTLDCDDEGRIEENQQDSESDQTNGAETQDASDEPRRSPNSATPNHQHSFVSSKSSARFGSHSWMAPPSTSVVHR